MSPLPHPAPRRGPVIAACLALFALALVSGPLAWAERGRPVLAAMSDEVQAPDLLTLLSLQRAVFPGAVVSSTFFDWRTPSRYRSRAGLHLGYDIALPAGTPAVVGWTGQVTRITPWSGAEHGITVVSPSGYETTYGHLRPRVRVGDVLNPGDVVGTVVIDHVDVKMRAPDGRYFDFGNSRVPSAAALVPEAGVAGAGLPAAGIPTTLDRPALVRLYLQAAREMRTCDAEISEAKAAAATAREVLAAEAPQVRQDRTLLEGVRRLQERGHISRQEVREIEARLQRAEQRRQEARDLLRDADRLAAAREGRRARALQTLAFLRARLAALGVSADRLRDDEKKEARATTRPSPQAEAVAGKPLDEATRRQLERYEYLFTRGAVSRQELEQARARLRVAPGRLMTH